MEQLEDYFFKKNTKWFFWGAGALILALLIFHAGYVAGRGSVRPPFPGRDFRAPLPFGGVDLPMGFVDRGHGAIGTITQLSSGSLRLEEPDGDTEEVTFASTTRIEGPGATSTLSVGEHIIVLGTPDEAHETILARFIHIAP